MGATSTDNFCLRWNDFAENVSGAFKELRAENDFFDVTLACSDSGARTLQAHKVILSACSNFFKTTFRQQMNAHKHPNPYIYLRGVSYSDLVSILDFIYNGEVNVAQEDLNSFLAVAEELQIKGLTNREGNSNNSSNNDTGSASTTANSTSAASSKKHKRPAMETQNSPVKKVRRSSPAPIIAPSTPIANISASELKEDKDMVNIKDDPEVIGMASTSAVTPDEAAEYAGEDFDESYDGYYEDEGTELGESGEATDGTKGSGKANKASSKKQQLAAALVASDEDDGEEEPEMMESGGTVAGIDSSHFALRFVRTKDGELTYQCGLCGYLPNSTNKSIGYAKSRVCMHIKNVHSEPTNVVCPRCAKKFKNKESLRVHRIKYCRDLAGNLHSATA